MVTTVVIGLQVWLLLRQNSIMEAQSSLMNGQLVETKKAADAARDAVALQKRSHQQWLNGDWSAGAIGDGDERKVQVSLLLKNPTQMSVLLKTANIDVAGKVAHSERFSVVNTLDILRDQGWNSEMGPDGSFQIFLANLQWMADASDRGTMITARVVFTDAHGDDSTTNLSAMVTWGNGHVILSPGIVSTRRNDKQAEQNKAGTKS